MPVPREMYVCLSKEDFDKLFSHKSDKGIYTVKAKQFGEIVYFIKASDYEKILGKDPVDDYIDPWGRY
jgi:formylmethanofuran dehydrogenase subunit D